MYSRENYLMNNLNKNFIIINPFFFSALISSALTIIIGCSSPEPDFEELPEFKNVNGTPYLVMAQQPGASNQPVNIKKNIEHIESMPFDGMFVQIIPWSWTVMNGDSMSYENIYSELSVLKGVFKKFQYNFLYIFINYPGDFWDDRVWEITTQNFALMARAVRETGLKGIVYDNEEYQEGRWLNYGEDYKNPNYDLDEHAEQVMFRGKQVMEAMVMEFPEIEIFNYHGPYLSEPNFPIPQIIKGQAASWDNYELLGPFFVGMMLGKGEKGTVIDGGEVYQYRLEEDFRNSYQIRKYEIASEETDSWFIPAYMRTTWPDDINISFGVYNRQWKPDYPMNPEIMRTTLFNALSVTDKYVWYYTEEDNWLEPERMPQEWIDVIKENYNLIHKKQ